MSALYTAVFALAAVVSVATIAHSLVTARGKIVATLRGDFL